MNYGSWLGSIPVQCFSVIDNCWWKKFYYYHCYFNSVKLAPRSSFLKKSDEPRIEAFEMKELRPVLRVSWIARKTNVWIMEKAGVTQTLLASIKTMKLRYFGLIMWHKCIEKDIIQGTALLAKSKTKDYMVRQRQHHPVDGYGLRKSTESNGQQKSMEKDDLWCAVNPRIEDDWSQVKSNITVCKCS